MMRAAATSAAAIIQAMAQRESGDFHELERLIRRMRIALLTTVDREGGFHSRPVQTLRIDPDHTLWFFTDIASPKADELRHDVRVSLGYADPSRRTYVAVSGVGTVYRDARKARELWSVEQRAYYPDGPEDRRLVILRVRIERAEYWIAPGRFSYLVAAARAAVSGVPVDIIGKNRKIE